MIRKLFYTFLLLASMSCCQNIDAQRLHLTLDEVVNTARQQSLASLRAKNVFLSQYWSYRSFKANRLPSLSLNITPAEYYRDITKRYDYDQNIDVYREQQSFYAGGSLSASQNFDLTGGTFYLNSSLGYMRNFGSNTSTQFTTTPVKLGYSQDNIGYNAFKWEKRIKPLAYEKAQKELVYNMEGVCETATAYFFSLAMAQAEYDMALENVASSDTLYRIGEEKFKIAAITQGDLLTLNLDRINARNTFNDAEISLKRAMFSLASFLGFDKQTRIELSLPGEGEILEVRIDRALELAKENNPEYLGYQQSILSAKQEVARTGNQRYFSASVNASVGFNQVAQNLREAYRDPSQQQIASISVSMPLLDWGIRKGRHNMAKSDLGIVEIEAQQQYLSIEEDVIMTVSDFTVQRQMIASAQEAVRLSERAYDETKQRFRIGTADINSLTLSLDRQRQARKNYVSTLRNYWLSYYKIRKLTLYDFERGFSLITLFDFEQDFQ